MPEQIRCPSCDSTLRVPENLLGKRVKCPKCQTTFAAAIDQPEEIEEMEEIEEIEEIEEGIRTSSGGGKKPARRPARRSEEEDDEPEEELDEEEDERPRRRRRRRRRSTAEAEAAVSGPAISLIVLGSLDIALLIIGLILRVAGIGILAAAPAGQGQDPGLMASMIGGIFGTILGLGFAILILMGGIKMKQLQSFGMARTAAILALLPCGNCCILGLPFGIWALVVLGREDVKNAFYS